MSKEPCLLWDGAKQIGEPRGLILRGECPVDSFCRKAVCFYISSEEEMAQSYKTPEERDASLQQEINFYLATGKLAPETSPDQTRKFLSKLREHFRIEDAKRIEQLRRDLINEG